MCVCHFDLCVMWVRLQMMPHPTLLCAAPTVDSFGNSSLVCLYCCYLWAFEQEHLSLFLFVRVLFELATAEMRRWRWIGGRISLCPAPIAKRVCHNIGISLIWHRRNGKWVYHTIADASAWLTLRHQNNDRDFWWIYVRVGRSTFVVGVE